MKYDRRGQPIDFDEWGRLFEDRDYQSLVKTHFDDGSWVSTVWMGIDHSFGQGPPLIFETMVFGGPHDQEQVRYATEEAAREGHEFIVTMLRNEVAE
jgi:hypothetical protein